MPNAPSKLPPAAAGPNVDKPADAPADAMAPASASNRARQARSRAGTTHPVAWLDTALERTYNVDRSHRNKATELRRLHRKDTSDADGDGDGGGTSDASQPVGTP